MDLLENRAHLIVSANLSLGFLLGSEEPILRLCEEVVVSDISSGTIDFHFRQGMQAPLHSKEMKQRSARLN